MVGAKIPWKTNPGPISEETGSNVCPMLEVSNAVLGDRVGELLTVIDSITAHTIFHILNP